MRAGESQSGWHANRSTCMARIESDWMRWQRRARTDGPTNGSNWRRAAASTRSIATDATPDARRCKHLPKTVRSAKRDSKLYHKFKLILRQSRTSDARRQATRVSALPDRPNKILNCFTSSNLGQLQTSGTRRRKHLPRVYVKLPDRPNKIPPEPEIYGDRKFLQNF